MSFFNKLVKRVSKKQSKQEKRHQLPPCPICGTRLGGASADGSEGLCTKCGVFCNKTSYLKGDPLREMGALVHNRQWFDKIGAEVSAAVSEIKTSGKDLNRAASRICQVAWDAVERLRRSEPEDFERYAFERYFFIRWEMIFKVDEEAFRATVRLARMVEFMGRRGR